MPSFLSDNIAGAHPVVMEAVLAANAGDALPYGDDELTSRLGEVFSELFEKETFVIPCLTGTAANALALSVLAGPTGAICVHDGSHVYNDECNAPEFFTGGARLNPIAGVGGKLDLRALEAAISRKGDRHAAQPAAISLAQSTELGTVYSADEISALGRFAACNGLKLHVDGARFANALAYLGCSPADITWRAGVDALSFGATKNGCLAAEAVIVFDPALAAEAHLRAKRSGHLLSKMRFISAQLLAYLKDGLWLANASQANAAARHLVAGLSSLGKAVISDPLQSNLVFVCLADELVQELKRHGLAGDVDAAGRMRLCTSWRTSLEDIDRLLAALDEAGMNRRRPIDNGMSR